MSSETTASGSGLKKTLSTFHLWGIAVGLVISGEYFGWSFGWGAAGTLGFVITTLFIALMYTTFIFSFTELTTSIPHAGGPFAYARRAFGPKMGFLAGMATLIEFVFAPPAIALAIGGYVQEQLPWADPKWTALVAYIVFMGLNIIGVHIAATFELFITLLAVFELCVFMGVVAPGFSFANFVKNGWGGSDHFTLASLGGIFAAIPFAIWFFLAIEGVAMAAEEAKTPKKSIPRAYIAGILTLVVLAVGVMLFAGGAGDWTKLASLNAPLPEAMKNMVSPSSPWFHMLIYLGLFGLIASFHGIIIGYSRQIYALARESYLPGWLAAIHPKFKTPWVAILAGGVVGIAAIFSDNYVHFKDYPLTFLFTHQPVEPTNLTLTGTIITMAVLGAILMYIVSMLSLFKLRMSEPGFGEGAYRTPFYPWFPLIALVGAIIAMIAMVFYNPLLTLVFLAFLGLGFAYYAATHRSRAAAAPVSLGLDLEPGA
jgi:ethanolamine permease